MEARAPAIADGDAIAVRADIGHRTKVRRGRCDAEEVVDDDLAVRLELEGGRDATAAQRIVGDGGGMAVRKVAADFLDADDVAVPRRPGGVAAPAIAEPEHGARQDARVLEGEPDPAIGAGR